MHEFNLTQTQKHTFTHEHIQSPIYTDSNINIHTPIHTNLYTQMDTDP
jgi:hypothetical protein